jgi:hypothetical protein
LEYIASELAACGFLKDRIIGVDIRNERFRNYATRHRTKVDLVSLSQATDIFGTRGAWQSVAKYLVSSPPQIDVSG